MTVLTVEMGMEVVVMMILVTMAELIFHIVASILDGVHEVGLLECCQSPEDIRFVNGVQYDLELRHGQRPAGK